MVKLCFRSKVVSIANVIFGQDILTTPSFSSLSRNALVVWHSISLENMFDNYFSVYPAIFDEKSIGF